jgi:hypothetical protein
MVTYKKNNRLEYTGLTLHHSQWGNYETNNLRQLPNDKDIFRHTVSASDAV